MIATTQTKKLKIKTETGMVSGILDLPTNYCAGLALAHGAGAGMLHRFMVDLAAALTSVGVAVLRYQFPYMEAGLKRTDHSSIATATVEAAVGEMKKHVGDVPLYASGKSFGARMTTMAASEGLLSSVEGLICYGFPLHAADKPSVERAKHLSKVPMPILFLQGTRDKLCDLKLMDEVCGQLPRAHLHLVEGGDHGFAVLKRSGRTQDEVMKELAAETIKFLQKQSS